MEEQDFEENTNTKRKSDANNKRNISLCLQKASSDLQISFDTKCDGDEIFTEVERRNKLLE